MARLLLEWEVEDNHPLSALTLHDTKKEARPLKNLVTLMLLALSAPLLAQDAADEAPAEKFTVHGYLTQAFAKTDGEQILGITKDGTTDYRRAAVLLRFTPTTKDALVIQIAHRRLGLSPSTHFETDLKLDWGFYERKLGQDTSLRVGRLPQPMGLLNETRYVGTLLPFYRTPYNFYQEGSFTSETVDGLALRHAIAPAKSWNAEISAYAGGFSMIESSDNGLVKTRAEKMVGGQVWLNTPLSGLRFGVGAQRFNLDGTVLVADRKDVWNNYYASGEYAGSRVKLRSEYRKTKIHDARVNFETYYVYGGLNVSSRLTLHAQFDTSKIDFPTAAGRFEVKKYYEDKTLGATFAVRPDVVVKGEYHWTDSQLLETNIRPIGAPSRPTNYGIVSMSVSF